MTASTLTIGNDVISEVMYYHMSGAALPVFEAVEIAFRMRFDSGSDLDSSRAGSAVALTSYSGGGQVLYIGLGEAFFNDEAGARSASNTSIVTDDVMHDYVLRTNGSPAGSMISLFQDGNLVLTDTLRSSFPIFGTAPRVLFGEFTGGEFGTSEWQSIEITPIPEPSGIALIGVGVMFFLRARRRV